MDNKELKAETEAQQSITDELLPSAPLAANPMLAVRAGEWLIRKWKDENGGEFDLVRFEKHINPKRFMFSKFYRVKKKKVENIMSEPFYNNDNTTDYLCGRMDYEFRLATKKEVKKLSKIIIECL